MKTDDTSNSNPNSCRIERRLGKYYTVFVPTSVKESNKIKSNPVIRKLAKHFDYVLAKPGAEECFTPEKAKLYHCKKGIEATALRKDQEKGSEQEAVDRDFIFKIADGVGKLDKPILLDVNDNITFYRLKRD